MLDLNRVCIESQAAVIPDSRYTEKWTQVLPKEGLYNFIFLGFLQELWTQWLLPSTLKT